MYKCTKKKVKTKFLESGGWRQVHYCLSDIKTQPNFFMKKENKCYQHYRNSKIINVGI